MPFDTVKRSNKRIRANLSSLHEDEDDDWYNTTIEIFNNQKNNFESSSFLENNYQSSITSSPPMDYIHTPSTIPIDIPYSNDPSDPHDSSSLDNITPPSSLCWQDDYFTGLSAASTVLSPSSPQPLDSFVDLSSINPHTADIFSKIQFSCTDKGINLEAKISNASDLRSLIDAFSHLCCTDKGVSSPTQAPQINNKIVLCRNKSNQTKPVNYFASTCDLGQIPNAHPTLDSPHSLREIADACIDTYFTCWVRFKPILKRDEFMAWYKAQERPTDTLIVNAICSYVFRHMVFHHPQPQFMHFLKDQDKLQEQEEYFFSCARECLAQSFDTPDRYTIAALLYMCVRAEPSRRHHYIGMAVSALHELEIYPRMAHEDADCYDKEMDTRLWWFVWAIDFYLWSAGAPKNTPQPRVPGEIDLPQVFEQDIDDTEIGVIAFIHCLTLWRIQADIVAALYDTENSELTIEQLVEYDKRLLSFYEGLPKYLQLDSGFEYGTGDLFMACLRVNIEYNATRIILHKLFIPEMHDPRPSQTSLDSLNICLSTALTQLSTIKTCNMVDVGRCAFDRDELWRAAEIVSVAMDIYQTCASSDDQARILRGIKMEDFHHGLIKSFDILRNTREFQFNAKNWLQVADWMQVEIRRHQLNTYRPATTEDTTAIKKPDFFLAHLKPHATLSPTLSHKQPQKSLKQPRRSISFQNQFTVSPQQQQQQHSRKSSFSTAPPFLQFNNYVPPSSQASSKVQPQFVNGGKSQARFRYFNPRKMNKFLFIDEHPMM